MQQNRSGGKSSLAIVEIYDTAVRNLKIKVEEMFPTLPDPTEWQLLKDYEDAKATFKAAFWEAAQQMNSVEQYYEYKWDDLAFGITEHAWLQYRGAYRNLFPPEVGGGEPEPVKMLVGKTKLSGTQVIDAAHILSLIGSKLRSVEGIQTVDNETLRIIYEQIQELSNMGEDEQARLLREFVDTELVPGKLSSSLNFDESFEIWKKGRLHMAIVEFANEWGLDSQLLEKSVSAFSGPQTAAIPYIDELIASVDITKATNQPTGIKLSHNMKLVKELPIWIAGVKSKIN